MLTCSLISPKETVTYDNLAAISLPSLSGRIQLRPGHAEAYIALVPGEITFHNADNTASTLDIPAAECHISHDKVAILL